MKNNNRLLIDVLTILPLNLDCFIQAPSLDDKVIQNMMVDTNAAYHKLIYINELNKTKFINQIMNNIILDYFQNIQIKSQDKLLFEGFDGVEYGILSKSIIRPQWFTDLYVIDGLCMVSTEW